MKHRNLVNPGVGIEIRLTRKRMAISLEELSWRTGISKSHLGRIERGEVFPSDESLRKIEDALELDYMSLEKVKRVIKTNESIEQTVGEIKIDLLNRRLSEVGIAIVAEVTRAVADVIEELDL